MTRWDKGLEYEKAKEKILNKLYEYADSNLLSEKNVRKLAYCCILLIQLRNGSRISEAIEAFKKWVETGKRELKIPVRKQKDPEIRTMYIPQDLEPDYRYYFKDLEINVGAIKMFCIREFKFNTHSLRYAFITKFLEKGISMLT